MCTVLQINVHSFTEKCAQFYREMCTVLQRNGHSFTEKWAQFYREMGAVLQRNGHSFTEKWAQFYSHVQVNQKWSIIYHLNPSPRVPHKNGKDFCRGRDSEELCVYRPPPLYLKMIGRKYK
jgi:hypothetical protein